MSRPKTGSGDDPGQGGGEAADDINGCRDQINVDASQSGRLLMATDSVDVQAKLGTAEHDVGCHKDHGQHHHRHGNRTYLARAPKGEFVQHDGNGPALGIGQRQATADSHHGQGGHERW